MKEIKLSQSGKHKNQYVALVDDENFDCLNQYKWQVSISRRTCYAMRITTLSEGNKVLMMHRVIMNTPEDMDCDHAFHNGLDDRKFIEVDGVLKPNLRNCTHQQNQSSQQIQMGRKYKGVCKRDIKYKDKTYTYYTAFIYSNNKYIHIANFKTEDAAALAYNREALKYFGEFAFINQL